jgi:hypothetical protein
MGLSLDPWNQNLHLQDPQVTLEHSKNCEALDWRQHTEELVRRGEGSELSNLL